MKADEIKQTSRDAAEAMKRAESESIDIDQDWAHETTTYVFDDGSRLAVCGPIVEVLGDD